jgi:4-hydroxy-4-methyl-2-oxoglutarate aldolase
MIKDPPVLTLRRAFARPAPDLLARFDGVPTGFVVDALGGRGALDFRIKPVFPVAGPFAGVAITSDNGPADNLALFGSLSLAGPGDILVAATDGCVSAAVSGDLLLGMAKNRGVRALVTDGLVRDMPGVRAVGLPAFAAGVSPNSPAKSGPGSAGMPVVLGGVRVASGDIVVADEDGVVVVPLAAAEAVAAALDEVRAAEAALEAKVKGGLDLPEWVRALVASDRVHLEG